MYEDIDRNIYYDAPGPTPSYQDLTGFLEYFNKNAEYNYWEINDIYDDEGLSTISFGHIDAPIYVWFWVSCDDQHQNRIILNYEVTIHEPNDLDDPQCFSHKTEVLNDQDLESCIKYIYKIVIYQ